MACIVTRRTSDTMTSKHIIYAETVKGESACEVVYGDGSRDTVLSGIGELFRDLMLDDSPYLMVGRSALVCSNNIIKVAPAKGILVVAPDDLGEPHLERTYFSADVLRKLRMELFYQEHADNFINRLKGQ